MTCFPLHTRYGAQAKRRHQSSCYISTKLVPNVYDMHSEGTRTRCSSALAPHLVHPSLPPGRLLWSAGSALSQGAGSKSKEMRDWCPKGTNTHAHTPTQLYIHTVNLDHALPTDSSQVLGPRLSSIHTDEQNIQWTVKSRPSRAARCQRK